MLLFSKKLICVGMISALIQPSWSQDVQRNLLYLDDSSSSYATKNFEFASFAWGTQEIGSKMCEPAGEELTKSLEKWFELVDNYLKKEKSRDQVLNYGIELLNKRILDLKTTNKPFNLQVESIQIQLSTSQLSIDSLKTRIELRNKLKIGLLDVLKKSAAEKKKWKDTYSKIFLKAGLGASLESAKKACSLKTPVKGCDEAIAQINNLINESSRDYLELYNEEAIASKDLNDRLDKLEIKMAETIKAIPASDDKDFDWHKSMSTGLDKMIEIRTGQGLICPPVKDKDNKDNKDIKISLDSLVYLKALGVTEELLSLKDKAKEKEMREIWKKADQVIGQSGQRDVYYKSVLDLLTILNQIDVDKIEEIKLNMAKLTKQLVGSYDLLSSMATVEEQCGTAPLSPPGGAIVCPSPTNSSWCDTSNPARVAYDSYNSCVKEVKTRNDRIAAVGKVSESLKKDPNFVGVELVTTASGSTWMAKMRNPDGTYKYVPLNYESTPTPSTDACSPFVVGPTPPNPNCPKPPTAPTTPAKPLEPCKPDASGAVYGPCLMADGKTNTNTNPAISGGGGGGGGGGSSTPPSNGTGTTPGGSSTTTPPKPGEVKPTAEELAEIEYKKQFNSEELKIYGDYPTKTNFRLTAQAQPYAEFKFSAKGSSVDLCTKSSTGKSECTKDDGSLKGRAYIVNKLEEKTSKAKFHRMSFEFTPTNYLKLNPNGYFMLGLRGSWELDKDKEKAKANMSDANGRGVIFGNIANLKENEGKTKCRDGAMEIKSFSKAAMDLGVATRKEMLFTDSCSDGLIKDGQTYKVEVDVLKSRHIFYRLYNSSGALIFRSYVQDPENSRIDGQLTGWFLGHVYDVLSDNQDNDNDGKVDNETANWTLTIKNLKVITATQLKTNTETDAAN